jgi:hypothetical protein
MELLENAKKCTLQTSTPYPIVALRPVEAEPALLACIVEPTYKYNLSMFCSSAYSYVAYHWFASLPLKSTENMIRLKCPTTFFCTLFGASFQAWLYHHYDVNISPFYRLVLVVA